MVLKYITYLCLIALFSLQSGESLLDQYQKKIKRTLDSVYDIDQFKLSETVERPFAYWEKYSMGSPIDSTEVILASIFTCNLGGCTAEQAYQKSKSSQEYFDILLQLKNNRIIKLKVLQYFSDYGYEVSSKNYLKKYLNRSVCEFSNFNDEVDGISGATISCDALQMYLGALCE